MLLDLGDGQRVAVHVAALDDQRLVFLGELLDRLGGVDRLAGDERDGGRTGEQVVEALDPGFRRSALDQRVLGDGVGRRAARERRSSARLATVRPRYSVTTVAVEALNCSAMSATAVALSAWPCMPPCGVFACPLESHRGMTNAPAQTGRGVKDDRDASADASSSCVGRPDSPGPSTDCSVTDGLRWNRNQNSVTPRRTPNCARWGPRATPASLASRRRIARERPCERDSASARALSPDRRAACTRKSGRESHAPGVKADVARLFDRNGGFATTAQLQTVMTRQQIDVQVRKGELLRVWYGVYSRVQPDLRGRLAASTCHGAGRRRIDGHCRRAVWLRHREHDRDTRPRPGRAHAIDKGSGGPSAAGRSTAVGRKQARDRSGVDGCGGRRAARVGHGRLPRSTQLCVAVVHCGRA